MVRYQPYRPSAPALPARAHPLAMTEVLEYPLVVPTREDFEALGVTKDLAFAEKRGCWSTAENNQKALQKAYESYLQQCPRKLDHCRIIKGTDENGKIIVYAACQLQMPGDPGDLMFSDPSWRHKLLPGEAYVEFIATHPDYTGKGLGSKLLAWAFEFCENYRDEDGNAVVTWLSLDVMSANEGAIRLYERKGFVVQKNNPHEDICDVLFTPICLYLGLGCRYCSITYMEKPIEAALAETVEAMERE